MKEIKAIDVRSAFRMGILFYGVVVGGIVLVFSAAEGLALAGGVFSVPEFGVGTFILLIGASLYVIIGGVSP